MQPAVPSLRRAVLDQLHESEASRHVGQGRHAACAKRAAQENICQIQDTDAIVDDLSRSVTSTLRRVK